MLHCTAQEAILCTAANYIVTKAALYSVVYHNVKGVEGFFNLPVFLLCFSIKINIIVLITLPMSKLLFIPYVSIGVPAKKASTAK